MRRREVVTVDQHFYLWRVAMIKRSNDSRSNDWSPETEQYPWLEFICKHFCQSNRIWRTPSGQLCLCSGSARHLLTSVLPFKNQRKMKNERDYRKGNRRKRLNRKSLKRKRPNQCDSMLPPLHHLPQYSQKRPQLKSKSNSYSHRRNYPQGSVRNGNRKNIYELWKNWKTKFSIADIRETYYYRLWRRTNAKLHQHYPSILWNLPKLRYLDRR